MDTHPKITITKNQRLGTTVLHHKQMAIILWLISKESKHGYALIKDMEEMGFKSFKASRIYPVLSLMCKNGLLLKHKKDRKIYYSIAPKGKQMMEFFKKWIRTGKIGEFFKEMVG